MPVLRTQSLADGQLDDSASTLLEGSSTAEGRVNVVLYNTGSQAQTVVLTFSRAGGTARRLARAELDADEGLLLTGVPLQPGDSLLGVASSAAAVDYLVLAGGGDALALHTLAADGSSRALDTAESPNVAINGQLTTSVHDDGLRRLLEELVAELKALAGR